MKQRELAVEQRAKLEAFLKGFKRTGLGESFEQSLSKALDEDKKRGFHSNASGKLGY